MAANLFECEESSWECLDGWQSEPEFFTCEEKLINSEVQRLRRKHTHVEIIFTPHEPPRRISRFDKQKYKADIRNLFDFNTSLEVFDKLLKEFIKNKKLSAESQLWIRNLINRRKFWLARKVSWVNYPSIIHGGLNHTRLGLKLNKFLIFSMRYQSKLINRKMIKYNKKIEDIRNKINNNRFYFLESDDADTDNEIVSCDMDVDDSSVIVTRVVKRRPFEDMTRLLDWDAPRPAERVVQRDEALLNRLRAIIKSLEQLRKKIMYRLHIDIPEIASEARDDSEVFEMVDLNPYRSTVQPEMMDPEQPDQQQEAGPVVLNALQQDETVATINENTDDNFWIENATSDVIVDQKHASAMEIMIKNFNWSSNDNIGKNLFNFDLPDEAIRLNPNHPAAMMFNQYAYWHGDIKIRIHINTTPFHVGKLIFSWYYSQKFDANAHYRDNIASSVLLPHVCYNASLGDDIVFTIPYRNYRSMLCTRKKFDDSLSLYMGTLRCHVFNPLKLVDNTQVDGYVHVSFINSSFTGICPRSTVQPEMLPMQALVKTAEKTFNIIDKVSNMDKPAVAKPPVMYMPQFTDSFATGVNDINNLHALRLDPAGQTQHPSGSSTLANETNMDYLLNQWGFLRTIVWNKSYNRSYNLFNMPVAPELAFGEYFYTTVSVGGIKRNMAVLPPVSVLAAINAFNRGSIEYKFEFINSKYHTGAALVSFTPVTQNVNLDLAIQSYNSTLDVGNCNEYIFKVPYINERPYNPRFNREISNNVDPFLAPIGELNLFVLNSLRNVGNTSEYIYINIYMRAGPDFELAVPVSPLYSVNYDGTGSTQDTIVRSNYYKNQLGLDTWRYMDAICNGAVIGKYGTGDDSIMQFQNIKPYTVYEYVPGDTPQNIAATVSYLDINGKPSTETGVMTYQYMAMFIVNGDKLNYKYVMYFCDLAHAIEYVTVHAYISNQKGLYSNSPTIREWSTRFPKQTTFYLGTVLPIQACDIPVKDYKYKESYSVNVEPNGDEVMCDPTISRLMSVNKGMRLFGERFVDLKDYCRRYQPYASFTLNVEKDVIGSIARIPLTPIGLDTSNATNGKLFSVIKEGLIPFVCSGYRFYRGSLRFKIVITNINGINKEGGNEVFYIQHKPDVIMDERNILFNSITTTSKSILFQTGYAYTALSTSVNNSITIEVPCYVPTNLLMLQKPNFKRLAEVMHYMMGCLDIYVECPSKNEVGNYHVNMHYSFGDDMDLSCFVGFSPMLPLSEKSNDMVMVQAEGGDEQPTSSKLVVKLPEEKQPKSEGFMQAIKDKASKCVSRFAKDAIRKDLNLEPTEDDEDSIWKIIKDVTVKYGEEYKHVIVSCISQIIHCINSPDLKTFTISIITFLSHLGLECYHLIPKYTKWFTNLFTKKVQPEAGDDNKTETSSIEASKTSIISSIVEASLALFGKTKKYLSEIRMPDFTSELFTNIRFGALTINSVITLFTNLFKIVPKIFSFLGSYINPKAWYRWLFFNENAFIKQWVKDTEWVLDPNNRVAVHSQVKYNYHIQLLVIIGRDLVNKSNNMVSDNNFKYIYDLNSKLNILYNEVALTNISSGNIGVEPFCFCIHGKSQVGKTYITKEVAAHCLKAVNYETFDQIFYTRPPTAKHWDGVQNEPVCIYDDFAHIKTPDNLSNTIGEFLLLKSKATFTPPRAHLTDKGRKYNPLIVALTMNESHPLFDDVCAEPTAWQNRRDVLIHAEFVAPKSHPDATRVQDLPEDVMAKMLHAKFSIHAHVASKANADLNEKIPVLVPDINADGTLKKVNDQYNIVQRVYMNIHQLKWYLGNVFKRKYQFMKEEYLKDIEQAKAFYPEADKSFEVNLENYRKYISSLRLTLNNQEKHTVELVDRLCKKNKCSKCGSVANCVCDTAIFSTSNVGKLNVQPESDEKTKLQIAIEKVKNVTGPQRITDIDACIAEILQSLPKLNAYYHREITTHLFSSLTLGTASKKLEKYLRHPCPHNLLMLLHRDRNGMFVDYDDDSWLLICNDDEHDIDVNNCAECKDTWEELELNKYKNILRYMITTQGLKRTLPDFLKSEDARVEKVMNKYHQRLEKSRKAFMEALDKSISPETWLGKVGNIMFSILKPLTYITGIVASIFALKYGYDYGLSMYERYHKRKEARIALNAVHSELIKNHEVTDECIANQCPICPQMAYDQHRAPKDKRKVNISTKQPEMALDVRCSLDRKLRRNYFFLVARTSYDTEVICRCLGVQSRAFICLDHYIDKIRSLPLDTVLEIRTSQFVRVVALSDLSFTKVKNSALLIGLIPRTLPQFASIVNMFVSASLVPNLTKEANLYILDIPPRMNKIENYDVQWVAQTIKLHDDTLYIPHIVAESAVGTNIDWYWSYQTSGKGLCGSVLVSDMNISSPIIGIHVAGEVSGGRGYAEVVCKDTLENIVNSLELPVKDVQIEGQMLGDRMIVLNTEPRSVKSALEGDFIFMGTVPSKYAYNPPKESKCIHSLCYNQITQSTYDVPHLHQFDTRFEGSPMVNGCMHHTNPPLEFPDELVDIAIDDVKNLILSKVKPLRQYIMPLSVENSICGIPSIPGYDAMELDTSEGFPFSSLRPKTAKDKRWLFDLDTDEQGYHLNGINPLVTRTMYEKNQMRKEGIIPLTIFTDCLKDLKLPKEKCHKTRIFSISPVDFTIQFRQYFYDFTIAFQKAMLNVESAVGINVDSYEWHDMVQQLMENSDAFVCGDYSKFGPRLMTKCVLHVFDIICEWYIFNGDRSLENKRIRTIMGYETAHAKHLMLNMVYEVMCGAPSGCPITTILNNCVNMIYLRVAYLDIVLCVDTTA